MGATCNFDRDMTWPHMCSRNSHVCWWHVTMIFTLVSICGFHPIVFLPISEIGSWMILSFPPSVLPFFRCCACYFLRYREMFLMDRYGRVKHPGMRRLRRGWRNHGDRWHTAAIAVHVKHKKPEIIPTVSHILRNQRQHRFWQRFSWPQSSRPIDDRANPEAPA